MGLDSLLKILPILFYYNERESRRGETGRRIKVVEYKGNSRKKEPYTAQYKGPILIYSIFPIWTGRVCLYVVVCTWYGQRWC